MDLRSDGERLYVAHDPFVSGVDFDEWLDAYDHAFIVLNTKEEGLEVEIASRLSARGITKWAFLDQSFPFLVKSLRSGETRTMVRISEFESVETALALAPRPDWVWVDSFSGEYPPHPTLERLIAHGYPLMVVSPELQGRDAESAVPTVRAHFDGLSVPLAAVCTKRPDLWL